MRRRLRTDIDMIRYRLRCQLGHEFEAWFGSSAAFDEQARRQQLSCAACDSREIEKALMAPAVAASTRTTTSQDPTQRAGRQSFGNQLPAEFVELARKVRTHVRDNADYVGDRFADEARRIHYEERKQRGIYGEATPRQARELHDEGIEVHPLPRLPEDAN